MSREEIISFIRQSGPVLPVQVAKFLNSNSLMASAILSELKSNGDIKLSSVKVGGSPLYYIEGQENQLMKYSDKLHEKEQEAYNSLRKHLVLRDREQPPHIRVALRAIKDFSKQIVVKTKDGEEVFWKWFLLSNEDAEKQVKDMILGEDSSQESKQQEPSQEISEPASSVQENHKRTQDQGKQIVPTQIQKGNHEKSKKEECEKRSIEEKSSQERKDKDLDEKEKLEEKKADQTPVFDGNDKSQKKDVEPDDEFLQVILDFFEKKNVDIHKTNVIRKNTEAEFFVSIPSAVGKLTYYCKAKSKKRITDSDLAAAYVQGEVNKLPVLFLITGELTKKAKDMLSTQFKSVRVTKVA